MPGEGLSHIFGIEPLLGTEHIEAKRAFVKGLDVLDPRFVALR